MTDTGTRTGIVYLQNDGGDAYTLYRTSIRNIVAALEAKAALASQTALGSRPSAGAGLRFWKDSGSLGDGVLYFDNGSAWEAIGASAPTDGSAATPSLRTLGAGATQAAAGNHTHAIGAITGAGAAASLNVGSTTGTVAAGDHTHTGAVPLSVMKASTTARTSATLVDDPELSLALIAGTWQVSLYGAIAFSGTSPGFSFRFAYTGTTSTAGTMTGTSGVLGNSDVPGRFYGAGSPFATTMSTDGNTGQTVSLQLAGTLVVTSSGTLTFRWGSTAASLNSGASLIAVKVA